MAKYIYELKLNKNELLNKDKFTVVYENKTYYYCKINGTDELRAIKKEHITSDFVNINLQLYKHFYTTSDIDVIDFKGLEKIQEERKKQKQIKSLESEILKLEEVLNFRKDEMTKMVGETNV